MSQSSPVPPSTHEGGSGSMFIGLIPWVLFTIIAAHGTLKVAAVASAVIALGVCLYAFRGGSHPKMIEVAALATFIVFSVIAFKVDVSTAHWLTRYARAIAAAVLAFLCLGSLLFVPFTEEYARDSVPRQYWSSPRFKAVNRHLTLVWAGVFGVMTCSHVIAGALNHHRTSIIFNWVIPIALVLWGSKQSTGARDDDAAPVQSV